MRLGSDPEVFLMDKNGKHISAIGLIMANKWHPLQIKDMPEGFTLQEDNVALEYGIPPAASAEEFVTHIEKVMQKSREWFPHLDFSKVACTIFDQDQMTSPGAFIFGCEPDFNAWTGDTNPSPHPPHPYMRSAGGHIHVETTEDPDNVIQSMDLFLGVPSVLMDTDDQRKQLYGKAGAHRKKPYGVEYRTLSNFWIFERKYMEWVWRSTERALTNLSVANTYRDMVIETINTNNKDMARALVSELSLEVV